jgi:hypothetical protein
MQVVRKNWIKGAGAILAVLIITLIARAQTAPAPGVTISPLGSNQYSIIVTNGVSTNYELYWTPVLGNSEYPWQLLGVGTIGETNFEVDAGEFFSGFFKASVEQVFGGVPDYELADPNNPSLGILTVTIDSPTNGAVLQ